MTAKYVVLDASVVLKWILPFESEKDMPAALSLRDAYATGKLSVKMPTLWA